MICDGRHPNPRHKEVVMRRWLAGLALLGLITPALADDIVLPTLHGSEPFVPSPPAFTRWGGFYFGGDLSKSSMFFDF